MSLKGSNKPYATIIFQDGKMITGGSASDVNYAQQGGGSNHKNPNNPFGNGFQWRDDYVRHHDRLELTDNYKFLPNGEFDEHFDYLRLIQEKSLLHSSIVTTASQFISGELSFKMKDYEGDLSNAQQARIAEIKQFYKDARVMDTHYERCYSLYAYGFVPILLNWEVGVTEEDNRFMVAHRNTPLARLGRMQSNFHGLRPDYHYYSYNWKEVNQDTALTQAKIKGYRSYFSKSRVEKDHVLRLKPFIVDVTQITPERAAMFSHFIGLPARTNHHYSKPLFETTEFYNALETGYELSHLDYSTVRRGLHSDYVITKYRGIYDSPEGDAEAEQMKQLDLVDIKDNYLGSRNAGTVKVNFMGLTYGGEQKRGEGSIEVTPIPNNNNYKEISMRKSEISRAIRTAHKVAVPELIGIQDTKTGFSNIAEYLIYGVDLYYENVVRMHQKPLLDCYNNIINRYNGFDDIQTHIKMRTGTTKALITLFSENMTNDEIRTDVLGREPLTDEQRSQLKGAANPMIQQQQQASALQRQTKVVWKSLDNDVKNKISALITDNVNQKLQEIGIDG